MSWKKSRCWVVYARYKDCEELPKGCEEEVCMSREEAEKTAEEWRCNDDVEEVTIEEEDREIWVD